MLKLDAEVVDAEVVDVDVVVVDDAVLVEAATSWLQNLTFRIEGYTRYGTFSALGHFAIWK